MKDKDNKPKPREKALKIEGTLDDVLKASVPKKPTEGEGR